MAIEVNGIIPWGRTFDEYGLIFGLSPRDLSGRILGCGDGPASFNAEATGTGHAVTSCDPVYALSAAEIERRVRACYEDVLGQVRRGRDGFVWDYFRDPDDLGQRRLTALGRFLTDFEAGKAAGRYVAAALPELPFGAGEFDLALVSHLLFLYSDHLSLDFHLRSVDELLRVSKAVRIFPVTDLRRGRSPHLDGVLSHLSDAGFSGELRRVAYEFQRGANQMLVISR